MVTENKQQVNGATHTSAERPDPLTVDWVADRVDEVKADNKAIHDKLDKLLAIAPTTTEKRAVLVFILTLVASVAAKMLGVHMPDVPVLLP